MKTFLITCIALSALACDDADVDVQEAERPLRPGPCSQHDALSEETLYYHYEFDDAARMTDQTILPVANATYESSSRAWTYSEAGFLTQVCSYGWESGRCERWTVNAVGTPVSGAWEAWVIHPTAEGTIAFDAQGRRTEFTEWDLQAEGGEPELRLRRTFSYAADKTTIHEAFGDQVRVIEEILDADGRVVERRVAPGPEAAFVVEATFTYADDQLSSRTTGGVRTGYTYDVAGNLLRRTGARVEDDAVVEDVEFDYGCFDRPELDLSSWAFDEELISDF